eukprot:8165505-Alexandrium_andersonii.AAC.1
MATVRQARVHACARTTVQESLAGERQRQRCTCRDLRCTCLQVVPPKGKPQTATGHSATGHAIPRG